MIKKYIQKIIPLLFFVIIALIISGAAIRSESNPLIKSSNTDSAAILLENYSNIVDNRNLKLMQLRSEIKAAHSRVVSSGVLMEPEFSYSYNITDASKRNHKLSLTQEFPLTSKLKLEKKIEDLKVNEITQMFDAERRKLIYQIKNIYFDIYFLAKQRNLTSENIELLKSIEAVLSAKYKTAKTNYADLIQIQIQIDELNNTLEAYEDMLQPLIYKFNKFLNRGDTEIIIMPQTLDINKSNLSEEEMQKAVLDLNPEIKTYNLKISAAETQIDIAKKEYVPDLMTGIDFETMRSGSGGEMSSTSSTDNTVMLMVSIKLPVWRKKLGAMIEERKKMKDALKSERGDIENILLSQLKSDIAYLGIAEKKIKLYRDSIIPKSIQTIEIIKNDYITNKANFKDLIENFKMYLEYNIMLERMKTEYNKMTAEIEMLTGN